MKCPSCKVDIDLSWNRYLKAPFSRHNCPTCGAKFTFVRTWPYYLWVALWIAALIGGSVYIHPKGAGFFGGFLLLMLAVYFVIDKAFESKLETKPR